MVSHNGIYSSMEQFWRDFKVASFSLTHYYWSKGENLFPSILLEFLIKMYALRYISLILGWAFTLTCQIIWEWLDYFFGHVQFICECQIGSRSNNFIRSSWTILFVFNLLCCFSNYLLSYHAWDNRIKFGRNWRNV